MQKLIDTPLSSDDIANMCSKLNARANILILADMQKMKSLNDVFKNFDHAFIFVSTNSQYDGHWQLILRNSEDLFFFDSYGHNFTKLLKKVFAFYGKNAYGESYKLGSFISQSSYFANNAVLMNTVDYQSMNPKDSTCGRHCMTCFYVWTYLKNDGGFNFDKYKQFMDNYKAQYKLKNYDEVVVTLTEKIKNR